MNEHPIQHHLLGRSNVSASSGSCGRVCIAMNTIIRHCNRVLLSLARINTTNESAGVMKETRMAVEDLVDGLREIPETQFNQVLFLKPIRGKRSILKGLPRLEIFHVQQALNIFQGLYSADDENQMREYIELPLSIHGVEIACVIAPRELQDTLTLGITAIQGQLWRILSEIKMQELDMLSRTDYLTGLLARGSLDGKGYEAISNNEHAAILFIDIDYFKHINDRYGHAVGDEVLQKVSEQIKTSFSGYICGRYGGEEFIVIIPNTDKDVVVRMAEEFRHRITQDDFQLHGNNVAVQVSIGIAHKSPNEKIDYNQLTKNADRALYDAKNNGRNQVRVFGG